MKALLFVLLAGCAFAQPIWIPAGSIVSPDLERVGPVAMTGSMRPAIHGGEYLLVEIYHGQPIHIGDIVGLMVKVVEGGKEAEKGLLHRVVAQNKRAVITSGDANPRNDGWTSKDKILYIVRYVERLK